MVKGVEEVRTELEILRLTDLEILEQRDVEVVNRWQQESVASNVGFSTRARLDVTCIGIVDQVTNHVSPRIGKRGNGAADAFSTIRIQYGAVTGAVTIQIGVIAAAKRDSLAGFVGVSARDVKSAEQCFSQAGAIREPRHLIDQGAHEAMAVI